MMPRFLVAWMVSLIACAASAMAQLDKPLPQALTGEANRAYESLLSPPPEPVFNMPSRVENPLWFRAEALLSWSSPQNLPPLLTTSPPGTPRATAGILGTPGTDVVIGGDAKTSDRQGFSLGFGVQPFSDYSAGIEFGFSMLSRRDNVFQESSDGSRILAQPVDVAGNAVLLAYPGLSSGTFEARASSGNLYTANITLTDRIVNNSNFHLTVLAGYRRYDMQEELNLVQSLNGLDPLIFAPGTVIRTSDRFRTNGTFQGADLGLRGEIVDGPFALEFLTRIAIGRLNRLVDIDGNTISTVPGAPPAVDRGGLLALVSNIGRYTSDSTQVMPEFGVVGKWQISRRAELRLGYSAFLLQGVARAADQIDPVISPENLPFPPAGTVQNGPRPAFVLRTSDIWVQQLSLGFTLGF